MSISLSVHILLLPSVSPLEPPILKDISDIELRGHVDHLLIIDLLSNTQFVERMIHPVSKPGTVAADARQRDGVAKATFGI